MRDDDILRDALEHHSAGRLDKATALYRRLLKFRPKHEEALYLLGTATHQSGHHTEAVPLLRQAIALAPTDARMHNVLGLSLAALNNVVAAEASYRQAIALGGEPGALNNLGNLLRQHGRLDEAIAIYRDAVRHDPQSPNHHFNLGETYRRQGDLDRAVARFRQALEFDPNHGLTLAGLGQVLQSQKQHKAAVPVLLRAIATDPNDATLHCLLGDALQELGLYDEAIDAYKTALSCAPDLAKAWYAIGCSETARGEPAAAAQCFVKALALEPGWFEAQHNHGTALFALGQVSEAVASWTQAAAGTAPERPLAMIAVVIPGDLAADNRAIKIARSQWSTQYLPQPRRIAPRQRQANDKLRIGYISAFFGRSNWMKPVWGLINQHDRREFELHLFSDGPRSAIEHGYQQDDSDHFHDISALDNAAAADLIAGAELDLLVDLNGYSATRRLELIALKPAPVLAGWFNMYATSGMPAVDYLIGDADAIPSEEECFCTERIKRVSGSYLTFSVDYPVPPVAPPPRLQDGVFTFGCLGSHYKITPEVIGAWSQILHGAPQARLLLKNTALKSSGTRTHLLEQFRQAGIGAERLCLEGPSEHFAFLQRYDAVDLALDTFPYNGGTTTTEAIWQGVPVLSFHGDRWASRTSASILRAGGLERFVQPGLAAYIDVAIEIARAPEELTDLRASMRAKLLGSPVCDTKKFAREMEQIYREMIAGA